MDRGYPSPTCPQGYPIEDYTKCDTNPEAVAFCGSQPACQSDQCSNYTDATQHCECQALVGQGATCSSCYNFTAQNCAGGVEYLVSSFNASCGAGNIGGQTCGQWATAQCQGAPGTGCISNGPSHPNCFISSTHPLNASPRVIPGEPVYFSGEAANLSGCDFITLQELTWNTQTQASGACGNPADQSNSVVWYPSSGVTLTAGGSSSTCSPPSIYTSLSLACGQNANYTCTPLVCGGNSANGACSKGANQGFCDPGVHPGAARASQLYVARTFPQDPTATANNYFSVQSAKYWGRVGVHTANCNNYTLTDTDGIEKVYTSVTVASNVCLGTNTSASTVPAGGVAILTVDNTNSPSNYTYSDTCSATLPCLGSGCTNNRSNQLTQPAYIDDADTGKLLNSASSNSNVIAYSGTGWETPQSGQYQTDPLMGTYHRTDQTGTGYVNVNFLGQSVSFYAYLDSANNATATVSLDNGPTTNCNFISSPTSSHGCGFSAVAPQDGVYLMGTFNVTSGNSYSQIHTLKIQATNTVRFKVDHFTVVTNENNRAGEGEVFWTAPAAAATCTISLTASNYFGVATNNTCQPLTISVTGAPAASYLQASGGDVTTKGSISVPNLPAGQYLNDAIVFGSSFTPANQMSSRNWALSPYISRAPTDKVTYSQLLANVLKAAGPAATAWVNACASGTNQLFGNYRFWCYGSDLNSAFNSAVNSPDAGSVMEIVVPGSAGAGAKTITTAQVLHRPVIIFVNDNLTFGPNANLTLDTTANSSVFFSVNGDIVVDPTIIRLDGLYLFSGTFSDSGGSSLLTVHGSLIGLGPHAFGVTSSLTRSPVAGGLGDVFYYDPKYLDVYRFFLATPTYTWQELPPN